MFSDLLLPGRLQPLILQPQLLLQQLLKCLLVTSNAWLNRSDEGEYTHKENSQKNMLARLTATTGSSERRSK